MWRAATIEDDPAIVAMCIAFYEEDPGERPVPPEHTRRTLAELRARPVRGRALVLDIDGRVSGYALLASFWSNELGGEICVLDELYVAPAARGAGHARALLVELIAGAQVAVDLEVTPANERARRLYESVGMRVAKNTHMRWRPG